MVLMSRLSGFILAGLAFATPAQERPASPTFGIGSSVDSYPAVEWIQGEPVTAFDQDRIYVVEAWATWCGPCKDAIPHINALHRKFGDRITFIGQSIWETDYDTVKSFVDRKGEGMSYRIAFGGGRDSDFSVNWMRAAGRNGIPATFVIQDNKVVWMPNPMQLTDETLQLLLDRKFSLDALPEASKPDPYRRARELIYREKNYEEGLREVNAVLEKHPENRGILFKAMALQQSGQVQQAIDYLREENDKTSYSDSTLRFAYLNLLAQDKRWDDVLQIGKAALAAAERARPGSLDDGVIRFMTMALHVKQDDAAAALAAFIDDVTARTDDPEVLAMVEGSAQGAPPSTHRAVADARFRASRKMLDSGQVNINVVNHMVENRWAVGEQEAARHLVTDALEKVQQDPRRQVLAGCLRELLAVLEEGRLPSNEEQRAWRAELGR
jgi:thiol-disulfide isomerase/thioredoxin